MEPQKANLLSSLQEAQRDGYILDFLLNSHGELYCINRPVSNPVVIQTIICSICKATLYIIEGENGTGTCIDHWEL